MYIVTTAASDQQQRAAERRLERERRALEAGLARWPACRSRACSASIACTASPSACAGREVERDRRGRELRHVVHRQRRHALAHARQRRQRHLHVVRSGHVQPGERGRARAVLRRHLQHHAVLVALREDGGHEALAEGVVQHAVDRRDADAEPPGGLAVDVDPGLQALLLLVAGDLRELRQPAQPLEQRGGPTRQLGAVGRAQRVTGTASSRRGPRS